VLVSILILAYNSGPEFVDVLRAACSQSHGSVEVLVLDNGSIHPIPDEILTSREFASVRFAQSATNLGFAAGMNQLFQWSEGDVIIFLNDDCLIASDFAEAAVRSFVEVPSAGALAANVRRGELAQGEFRSTDVDDGSVLRITRTMRVRKIGTAPMRLEVEKPNGSCPSYRREVLHHCSSGAAKPFDPIFDTYGEDIDLALRLRSAGHRTVYCPDLEATHLRSASSTESVLMKSGRLRQNILAGRHINARRHLGLSAAVVTPVLYLQDAGLLLRGMARGDRTAIVDVRQSWRRARAERRGRCGVRLPLEEGFRA